MGRITKWAPRAALGVIGAGGFATLLIASSRAAELANAIRVLALLWFVGFGALATWPARYRS